MRRRNLIIAAGLVGALAVAGIAYAFFLPKGTTRADDALPEGAGPALKAGTFSGADSLHDVSGTVSLHRAADGSHFLRFDDYEATDGPDVYLYLTRDAGGHSTESIEGESLRVLVPGGKEGGHATVRGNFNVPLPAEFDPEAYRGVAVWCDRFNTLFGSAELS